MARKILLLLFPVAIAVLVAVQWQELVRYFKIEQMDFGGGHPEVVPAEARRHPLRPAGPRRGPPARPRGSQRVPYHAILRSPSRHPADTMWMLLSSSPGARPKITRRPTQSLRC